METKQKEVIKLEIPEIPESNNKFMGNSNSYHIYRNEKKKWEEMIILYSHGHTPEEPFNQAIVTLQYYFSTRHRRDPDNYSGKMLLDGLTKAGLIADDSFSNIQLKIKGGYDKENPRTEITIEKCEF